MRKGFTLVEIVLVVGLTSALLGIVMARYRNYAQRQAVMETARRIEQVLLEAKSNALTGKKDCYACGGADRQCNFVNDLLLVGWRVQINPGSGVTNGYRLAGLCGPIPTSFMLRDQQFEGNVAVTASTSEVIFEPLDKGTNLAGNMTITVSGSGITQTITITPTGQINL